MCTQRFRQSDGSVMLAIPQATSGLLRPEAEAKAELTSAENLIGKAKVRPRYTLDELLSISDYTQAQPFRELEWVDGLATGRELL